MLGHRETETSLLPSMSCTSGVTEMPVDQSILTERQVTIFAAPEPDRVYGIQRLSSSVAQTEAQ